MGWQDSPALGAQPPQAAPQSASAGGQWQTGTPLHPVAPPAVSETPAIAPGLFNPFAHTIGENLTRAQQVASESGLADFARAAANSAGIYDRVAGALKSGSYGFSQDPSGQWVSGVNPDKEAAAFAQERAQTEAARSRLGLGGSLMADVVGTLPFGGLSGTGIGKGISEAAAPTVGRFIANRLGGAAETGAMSTAMAAGRGDDPAQAGTVGTLIGALLGPLGMEGTKAAPSAADLAANTKQAFKPLSQYDFSPTAVKGAYDAVHSALDDPTKATLSPGFYSKLDDVSGYLAKNNPINADQINKYQRAIRGSIQSATDAKVAQPYLDALDNVLFSSKPISGQGLGMAGAQNDAAQAASNVEKTNADFTDWLSDPSKAPAAIARKLKLNPQFYDFQPGLTEKLQDISQMNPGAPGGIHPWQGLGARVGGFLGEHFLGAPFMGELAGWIAGHSLGRNVPASQIANALKDAQYYSLTGQKYVASPSTIGEGLRQITSRATMGGFPEQTTKAVGLSQ